MRTERKPDGYITVHRVIGSHHKGNWVCRSRVQTEEEARLHREQLDALFTQHKDMFETVSLPVYIDHDAPVRGEVAA